MDDDLRFTQSLGKWEAALAIFHAMVRRDTTLSQVEIRSKTRMGATISLSLAHPTGWSDESWGRVEHIARQMEKQYPGLVLLVEKA